MKEEDKIIKEVTENEYKYGFTSDLNNENLGVGLTENIVRLISEKKGEPEWLLEYRLKAFRFWEEHSHELND